MIFSAAVGFSRISSSAVAIRSVVVGSTAGLGRMMMLMPAAPAAVQAAAAILFPLSNNNLILPLQSNQQQVQIVKRYYRSNRSKRGLYDGVDVRTGNNVSFSKRRTKRKFKPNIQLKTLYSETLDDNIKFHVSTKALRSIDKAGGLDNYLLAHKFYPKSEGQKIKKAIKKRLKIRAYFARKQMEWAAAAAEQAANDGTGTGTTSPTTTTSGTTTTTMDTTTTTSSP